MNPTPGPMEWQGCLRLWRVAVGAAFLGLALPALGQELEPGAYSPAPVGVNIVLTAVTYNTGDLMFDPSLPIEEEHADISSVVAGYVRTIAVGGRLASVAFAVPYVRGDLEGRYLGEIVQAHRSGFADPRLRFAITLAGLRAMTPREFATTPRSPTVFGASVVISLPLGQYYPNKLVNIGSNRWGFRPELGVRHTVGRWTLEGDVGAWLYLDNTDFVGRTRSQDPIATLQLHVIYTFKARSWLALATNYFTGGRTAINGRKNQDEQRNSRLGLTYAWPLDLTRTIKFAYSRGAITNIGAAFDSYGIAYQQVW